MKKKKLTKGQLKIYNAIMKSFPKTNPNTAYDYAIQGGLNFQFICK